MDLKVCRLLSALGSVHVYADSCIHCKRWGHDIQSLMQIHASIARDEVMTFKVSSRIWVGFKRVTLRTVDRCYVCWYAGGYTSSCFHCKATGWRDSGPWNSWSGASSGEDVDEIGYDMIRKHGWKTCVGLTHENVWANMCSDVPQEQKELVPDLLGQQEARPSWWMWVC